MEFFCLLVFIYIANLIFGNYNTQVQKNNKSNNELENINNNDILFNEITEEVFKIYGKNCILCGSSKEINIVPIEPYTKHNDIYNLIPLCSSCFNKIQSLKTKNNKINLKNLTWEKRREKILQKYNYQCYFCGTKQNLQIHHIIPILEGGTNDNENLIPLCVSCHEKIHGRKFAKYQHKPTPQNYGYYVSKKHKNKIGFQIINSIKKKYKIKIKYKNKNNEITERIISPKSYGCGKKYFESAQTVNIHKIYVKAFCELRNEIRYFRLDRIICLEKIN